MLKACVKCGRVHDTNIICRAEKKRKGIYAHTEENEIRSTYKWKKKREEIKRESNYCCTYCKEKENKINTDNLEVHHIIKIKDNKNLSFENSNLILLCKKHHEFAEAGFIKVDELVEMARVRGTPHGYTGE